MLPLLLRSPMTKRDQRQQLKKRKRNLTQQRLQHLAGKDDLDVKSLQESPFVIIFPHLCLYWMPNPANHSSNFG